MRPPRLGRHRAGGTRLARAVRRFRGPIRDRGRGDPAAAAETGGDAHGAGCLRRSRGGRRRGRGDDRRRDPAGGDGDHGCARDPGGRVLGAAGLPRRAGAPDRRARRRARRRRGRLRAAERGDRRLRGDRGPPDAGRGRASADLEGAQERLLGGRLALARLHRPGRLRAAHPARRGARGDRGDERRARPAGRERVPRGRRQPAPADPVRRPRAGRRRSRGRARKRDPRPLRPPRRFDHRRARRGSREARAPHPDVRAGRPRPDAPPPG